MNIDQSPTLRPTREPSYESNTSDTDTLVTSSVVDVLTSVTQERNQKLAKGQSLRDINDEFVHEYSHYLASITHDDERVIHDQVSKSLIRSGKEASATLLQLVVGARVYQRLGMVPTAGVFSTGGAS